MHIPTLTLLASLSAGALSLPTTLNMTVSLIPRAADHTTIATFSTPDCKGPPTNLQTEGANGGCLSYKLTGRQQYLGIHWGVLGAQGEGIGYTGWTSNDCSGKWDEMMEKSMLDAHGKPNPAKDTCIKLGDVSGSLKVRHRNDGKAQGPWIDDV